ncbi:hypothetical protein LDENG_00274610 [Lucifuga dentata]|nr:hypothetical protein LDENG_00274610 [Lucifuga dentata]
MSSANIIVQGDSCLTSSVSLSITTANSFGNATQHYSSHHHLLTLKGQFGIFFFFFFFKDFCEV